jgi:hypothetical protein
MRLAYATTVGAYVCSHLYLSHSACRLVSFVYALVLTVRCVNGLVDSLQQGLYAQNVMDLAASMGLAPWVVELRHNTTHSTLPTLASLRMGSRHLLNWLLENYWKPQEERVQHLREQCRSMLTNTNTTTCVIRSATAGTAIMAQMLVELCEEEDHMTERIDHLDKCIRRVESSVAVGWPHIVLALLDRMLGVFETYSKAGLGGRHESRATFAKLTRLALVLLKKVDSCEGLDAVLEGLSWRALDLQRRSKGNVEGCDLLEESLEIIQAFPRRSPDMCAPNTEELPPWSTTALPVWPLGLMPGQTSHQLLQLQQVQLSEQTEEHMETHGT